MHPRVCAACSHRDFLGEFSLVSPLSLFPLKLSNCIANVGRLDHASKSLQGPVLHLYFVANFYDWRGCRCSPPFTSPSPSPHVSALRTLHRRPFVSAFRVSSSLNSSAHSPMIPRPLYVTPYLYLSISTLSSCSRDRTISTRLARIHNLVASFSPSCQQK